MKQFIRSALILASILSLLSLISSATASSGAGDALMMGSPQLHYVESSGGLETPQLDGGPTEIEMGDVNGDGHPDIVSIGDHGSPFINTNQHGVMVWFGDGQGNWNVFQNGLFGYGGVALGDVNNDGHMDVGYGMHHNYSGEDFGDQLIEVALGDGSGQAWQPWDDGLATNGETWGMSGTDFADVDNDGDLDLASNSFGCCSGIHVYRNNGDGSWTQSFGFVGGNGDEAILFGDVNGDGHADVIASHADVTVLTGDGAGDFSLEDGNLPSPGFRGHMGIAVGDVNGDGRDDLAFCHQGNLSIWSWTAPQSWANLLTAQPPTGSCLGTQIADMNGDGHGDVVVYLGGIVAVVAGNSAGQWRLAGGFQVPGDEYTIMRVGDVDHNGRRDIALIAEEGGFNSRNRLRLFKEDTLPAQLRTRLDRPRAGAMWIAGSVRFVEWLASVPAGETATATLELSTSGPAGPWSLVAENLPNNGRYQWLIPASTPPTSEAYLRITLATGGGSTEHVGGSFTIAGGGS